MVYTDIELPEALQGTALQDRVFRLEVEENHETPTVQRIESGPAALELALGRILERLVHNVEHVGGTIRFDLQLVDCCGVCGGTLKEGEYSLHDTDDCRGELDPGWREAMLTAPERVARAVDDEYAYRMAQGLALAVDDDLKKLHDEGYITAPVATWEVLQAVADELRRQSTDDWLRNKAARYGRKETA
jgi:hypothetical protein